MCKEIKIKQVGRIYYVKGKGLWKGYCSICGKKRKTSAHHLIPKRVHELCFHPALKELRISVCKKCEDQIHPENLLINESGVIRARDKYISNLKASISRERIKIVGLKNMVNLFKKQTKDSFGQIINILNFEAMNLNLKTKMKGGKKKQNGKNNS